MVFGLGTESTGNFIAQQKTNAGHVSNGIIVNIENVGCKHVFVTSKIIIYHMLLRLLYTPLELTALSLKRNASGTFFSFVFSSKKSNQGPDLISFCCSTLGSYLRFVISFSFLICSDSRGDFRGIGLEQIEVCLDICVTLFFFY